MKICPKCNRQFGHEQRFCLEDGALLIENLDAFYDDTATVLRTNPGAAQKSNTSKIAFAVVALIALGALAFAGVLLLRNNDKGDALVQSNNSPDYELKKKELDLKQRELDLKSQEMNNGPNTNQPQSATPTQKLPPVQYPSEPTGTKYSGTIGSSPAVFTLNWNGSAKTVSGSYYLTSNPSRVYPVSGTNFPAGQADLAETGSNGRMKIYKSIKGKLLCWAGTYYGGSGSSDINFCRYR